MSRILVTGINFAPEPVGTGKYTGELCAWLATRGHDVRVVTAPPYYPAWQVWTGHRTRWFRRERWNDVDVIRCPTWVPRQPRGATRLLHLASFGMTSLLALLWSLAWRPQLVINIAPTLASAPGAWLLARLSGARCWLHIQDFEVDAALDMGIVDAGPLRRCALAVERWLLRRFDRVSTISERMRERLGAKGVEQGRQVLFPNWVDTHAIAPLTQPSPYRAELGIPGNAVVALYSGNMGLKQGLEILSQAANALSLLPREEEAAFDSLLPPAGEGARRADEGALDLLPQSAANHPSLPPLAGEDARRADGGARNTSCEEPSNSPNTAPDLYFVFGGEGPARATLESACAHLPNVRFLDLQPTERLNDWLGLADIHLLPQRADVADLVMPSKLTGMLASGRAILATALPGTGVANALIDSGVVTPPADTAAFVSALATLAGDNTRRQRLGAAARAQAVATLSREAVLLAFEQHLNTLLGLTVAGSLPTSHLQDPA
jgi:colanic acid biosynthesis glycosyl transferase WcaI